MKVSLNLAQEFSNVDLKSIPRDELLQRIGAQLGAVEDVIDWAPKFEGAVIVHVVSCVQHPNADKLHICKVDDGGKNQHVARDEDGLVQVVCGAPNVQAGMFAVWLAPGVTVPKSRETDPFVLEAREIRGVVSYGMMASASELGISDDHSGIVNVTTEDAGKEPVPGEALTQYFGLDDYVIDCENKMFTHRPDCFGNLGVAREFAGITGQQFKSPDWYLEAQPNIDGPFSELPFASGCETNLVPRFTAQVLEGVSVQASPMWLQATLARVGIKPINNIVDLTNYYMHLTGQPTHAFDYDKIKALSVDTPTLTPRMAQNGEQLTLLGGKTIILTEEDIVIATDKQPIALAGIMGGADTEVDETTENIIIECATFNMYAVRKSSMRHGLFTDASTRFTKGQSPYQNLRILYRLVNHIAEVTGAREGKMSNFVDCNEVDVSEVRFTNHIEVHIDFINSRLGSSLSAEDIARLLENVEFAVSHDDSALNIKVPFWRMDIEQPEDIVEEIGRLFGYDKLDVTLPKRTARPTPKNTQYEYAQTVRQLLKESGANEVLTYSFVHSELLKKVGINADTSAYHLRNAISPDLQYYRPSLLPSLLAKIHPNIKAQAGRDDNQFALYEIGRAHVKGHEVDGLPEQMERLAIVVAADEKTAKIQQSGTAYYLAKKYLDRLTDGQAVLEPIDEFNHPVTAPFANGRSAIVKIGGEAVGVIGEFSVSTKRGLKLPDFCAGVELDIVSLRQLLRPSVYTPLPPFPGTHQDYTQEVASDVAWQTVHNALSTALTESNDNKYQLLIEPLDIFQPKDASSKRLTFRIYVQHPAKTLKTEEVTRFIASATQRLSAHFTLEEV